MNNILCKRNYSLDIARIIAMLAVVMIHCSAPFVSDYKPFSNEFICGNLFDSVSRIGVPLFLMISGALFLDERKQITLKDILFKNVKTLAIITIIWAIIYSVIYKGIFPILLNKSISIKGIIVDIISGHYHMWYLYMIIGLYIITPFLKKFVCKENKGMVLFFICVSFCFQFFKPTISALCELGVDLSFADTFLDKFHLNFFGGYITYFLVGWYIVHVGIKQKWVTYFVYFLGVASLALIVLFIHFTGDYENAYENINAPVFIFSLSVFLALNNIKFNFKEKSAKVITNLSKLSFGVYIIHPLVLTVLRKLFSYSSHSALYIVVCFVMTVFSSLLITYVISKIPVIKKLIKA